MTFPVTGNFILTDLPIYYRKNSTLLCVHNHAAISCGELNGNLPEITSSWYNNQCRKTIGNCALYCGSIAMVAGKLKETSVYPRIGNLTTT